MEPNPFSTVVAAWLQKIQLGINKKNERFGPDAQEGMNFFNGPYHFLYSNESAANDRHLRRIAVEEQDMGEIPPPRFQMTCNKVAEMVQIFGPVMYHRNPVRQVNPRAFTELPPELVQSVQADPQMAMFVAQLGQQQQQITAIDKTRAALLATYLNYTPTALDLKTESRRAIDEAIIKGMGLLWQQVYTPPGAGSKMVGSFYDSVDNLVIDPDAKILNEAKWVARRCTKPIWLVEQMYGLQPGSVRPNAQSSVSVAENSVDPNGQYAKATGKTSDLLTYWEVYSKCGIGNNLTGVPEAIKPQLAAFGQYTYCIVADGVDFLINVPQQMLDTPDESGQMSQMVAQALQWPTPFWADGGWPFVPIQFHEIPGDPWPMSHLSPGLGELKFINWMFSYLAGKIRITARDFIAIDASAAEDLVNTMLHGTDLTLLKIKRSAGKSINEIVQFLQHPQFNGDVWRVVEHVMELFDRRVGLTELMYGMSSASFRSAAEANVKREQLNIRPEDMANKVEDAMSLVARQEALAARWHLTAQDVGPVMGPVGQTLWNMYVTPANPAEVLFQLEYRIEAGSARKPNKDRDASNINQIQPVVMPFYQQLATMGMQMGVPALVQPFNNFMALWGKTNDMDVSGLLLPVPQPMQPTMPPPQQEGDNNGEGKPGGVRRS